MHNIEPNPWSQDSGPGPEAWVTKCDQNLLQRLVGITKSDRKILQSATGIAEFDKKLIKSATGNIKCDKL